MPHSFKKVTPNLVVADVSRSIAFYRDVLGFSVAATVPDEAPHVFAMMQSGEVTVFLNSLASAVEEYPAFGCRPIGGTLTLFIDVDDIQSVHAAIKDKVKVARALEKKWYGPTEFAFEDPDGYLITLAEHEPAALPAEATGGQ